MTLCDQNQEGMIYYKILLLVFSQILTYSSAFLVVKINMYFNNRLDGEGSDEFSTEWAAKTMQARKLSLGGRESKG